MQLITNVIKNYHERNQINMKINWRQKLSSRKFWAAAAGFISSLLVVFRTDEGTITQVSAIITAGGVLVAYILGEAMVDSNRTDSTDKTDLPSDKSEKSE